MKLIQQHEVEYIKGNTRPVVRFGPVDLDLGLCTHWIDRQGYGVRLGMSGAESKPKEDFLVVPDEHVKLPVYEIAPAT